MKLKDFERYKRAFAKVQKTLKSPIVQEAVLRTNGGGAGNEIRTIHILYSGPYRQGQRIPAHTWMESICKHWNKALQEYEGDDCSEFELESNTVGVTVSGSVVKATANISVRALQKPKSNKPEKAIMTTVNQKTVTDQDGQEIVVSINVDPKLHISFQRTGIDSSTISLSATVTESGVSFDKGFPSAVSSVEQDAITDAASEMLVHNVFGG